MNGGLFKYEDCLLKHYVRTHAWLPICKERLAKIREQAKPKHKRRLRYFTFCAVGALDVLMLDVAKVITQSKRGFDTVYFFDKNPEHIIETTKRIPGAIGFPEDFVNLVLLDGPEEEYFLDSSDFLVSPEFEPDEEPTRRLQTQRAIRQKFILSFPFDVINLDLEGFFFKPRDPFPGKMVNALRKIFAWQTRNLVILGHPSQKLDGFSLMFTTQIGPPNLSEDYLDLLRGKLEENISNEKDLEPLVLERCGTNDLMRLQKKRFDVFYKLAMPKVLAAILLETDWYVDPARGIQIYEYERPLGKESSYKILHLIMDVNRSNPPIDRRAPGDESQISIAAHREVINQIFSRGEHIVNESSINRDILRKSLDEIIARRKKYYPYN